MRLLTTLVFTILMSSCNGQVKTDFKNNLQKNKSTKLAYVPKPKGINKEANFSCGIQDFNGVLWFGSVGEGVYRYDGKMFDQFTVEQGLNSNTIYSILQDENKDIWVGTNKGLNRFNGNKFENIPIVLSKNSFSFLNQSLNKNPQIENAVWCIMQDKNRTIWFGTDDGVFCYNEAEFTSFLNNRDLNNIDRLELKGIFSILEDKSGKIWFAECANEGVSCYDGRTLSNIIPYNQIGRTDRVIEDKKNVLWFATAFKGVGRYDGKTFTRNYFKQKNLDGQYNILEDVKGNIWFDSQDGLGCYDGKKLMIYTEKDGLKIKNFIPILSDKSGNLWFSDKGMKLYKFDGRSYINYSE